MMSESESNDSVPSTVDIEDLEARKERMKKEKLEAKKKTEAIETERRREKALKSMSYLLRMSESYSKFFKEKLVASNNSIRSKTTVLQERNRLQPTMQDVNHKELTKYSKNKAKDTEPSGSEYSDITKHMIYFNGGSLRPYQVEGVAWMKVLKENGVNGILADEMGLGKTIQVIALICHFYETKVNGPYLIVAPLSTIPNWASEFKRFAPQLPVIVFHGNQDERAEKARLMIGKFPLGNEKVRPVVITTYQMPLLDKTFNKLNWQYIIIDEGHRIKNHESKLAIQLRSLQTLNRLLLTGTPLQNNITELWALLNFLMPHIFKDMSAFASLLLLEDMEDGDKLIKQEESSKVISTIHKVLAPFVLRRLKKDVLTDMVPKKEVVVYCPLSKLQKELYSYILDKNIEKLQKINDDSEAEAQIFSERNPKRKCSHKNYKEPNDYDEFECIDEEIEPTNERKIKKQEFLVRLTMSNPVMMFKKVVDHPYLIHFPLNPNSDKRELLIDENIITSSGKMMVLDTMLSKLKEMGHKVLIFSTLVMALDFVEELIVMRNYKYCRLDGSQKLNKRGESIEQFNKDPSIFVFLISTRAGGLGLNLTGADTVIFFDRDWNPQADIQAQDRCHRIGQTKPVMVYTLVAKNTIDERILTCGDMKRRLERIIIKDGKFKNITVEKFASENELLELKKLLDSDRDLKIHSNGSVFSNSELEELLDRSELFDQMKNSQMNVEKI